eukprot:TRINITY_DN25396_c0_g2_i1.p1 TRINITY_DN25396_c0_g2~~TRINITY_DN25396_c0_g2_i1.p1  ORF type:complete len:511 (+),score=67.68 TRINITY_DN25396_c0_g2_i1:79-1533(+)
MTVARQLLCLTALSITCMAMRQEDLGKDNSSGHGALQLVLHDKPEVCDAAIVHQTCRDMDRRNNPETVTATEIAFVLSATRSSTIAALKHFDLHMDADPRYVQGGDVFVTCAELCAKVVASIPTDRMPPSSDVGCRHGDDGQTCDIDLSPEVLGMVKFGGAPLDFHAGHPVPHNPAYHEDDESAEKNQLSITGIKITQKGPEAEEVTWEQAQIKLANLFRIYPVTHISIDDQEPPAANSSLMESDETESAGCQRMYCSAYSKSEMCSVPSCHNCRACRKKVPVSRPTRPSPPTITPSSSSQPEIKPTWPEWRRDVEKISIKSQAYVAQAIRHFQGDRMVFRRWFGNDGPEARRKAMQVLNSVSSMLSNVVYVRNPPKCEQKTYAFVYPYGPNSKNSQGQFRFYLCPLYFRVNEGEQIETLTHEGSHHATAFTDDVCADNRPREECRTAYGRQTCEQLAVDFPQRAINNADNFCYYINDLAKSKM